MNIFLKKVRVKTIFTKFEPIKVEPLELCYLKTVADEMGHNAYIIDELFDRSIPTKVDGSPILPDIIVLTGYNVAENEILRQAKAYKSKYPNVVIIVGGVHIQLNASSFYKDYIDYVIHSGSLDIFRNVIKIIQGRALTCQGFDYRVGDRWIIGEIHIIFDNEGIYPDREFFRDNKGKIRYLDKKRVALIKGSVGCPYKCSYCYCREVNGGEFLRADYKKMAKEISTTDADYFWIVDDMLFINRNDAIEFIDEVKRLEIKKKFIAYLRADFIIKEEEIISRLKEIGFNEVIIGFEAVSEEELLAYNKMIKAVDYPKVISILKRNNLDFIALFMVQPRYGFKDFYNLHKFIKKNNIEIFTFSIFTPIKGTKGYDEEKSNLLKDNPKCFDFLHLVTKSKLPKPIFYLFFYGLHLRLIKSKRIRDFLLRR